MKNSNRDFKGIWVPKEIWVNKKLTLNEKMFLVEIDSLDNDENGCFASNAHFAEMFDLSKGRCTEIIKSLEKKGLISIELIRKGGKKSIEKRILKVFDFSNRGIREVEEGYSENTEGSNTVLNNTKDIADIVSYLNLKADKEYKPTSSITKKHINARIKDGYEINDFKKVIDVKSTEWLGTKWEMYLIPSTLFRPENFERYLTQAKIEEKKKGDVKYEYFKD